MLRLHEYSYVRPTELEAALDLLGPADAMPIAGGTDLVPNMKHRLFTPNRLVALGGIRELKGIGIRQSAGADVLWIGATETLSSISRSPLVREHLPSLAKAAGSVAGPQIRNQGTLGGNLCLDTRCTYYNQSLFWRSALGFCLKKDGEICHVTKVGRKCVAAHSADTPPVLITLDAEVELVSPAGRRHVPVADFFVADGIWNTIRSPGELVAGVRVPIPRSGVRMAYQKVRQRGAIDFPLLSIALAADVGSDSVVREMRLVVSALGARPRAVAGLEKVVGEPLGAVTEMVAELAHRQCHPLENIIVDPDWRRAMVPVYVRRALKEIGA